MSTRVLPALPVVLVSEKNPRTRVAIGSGTVYLKNGNDQIGSKGNQVSSID